MYGAVDLGVATDQGVDLPFARFLVQVDAIGVECIPFLLQIIAALGVGLIVGAAHRSGLGHARPLGDAVTDVIHSIVARHILLLQEIGRMTFPLSEDGHQHVCTSHLLASR